MQQKIVKTKKRKLMKNEGNKMGRRAQKKGKKKKTVCAMGRKGQKVRLKQRKILK